MDFQVLWVRRWGRWVGSGPIYVDNRRGCSYGFGRTYPQVVRRVEYSVESFAYRHLVTTYNGPICLWEYVENLRYREQNQRFSLLVTPFPYPDPIGLWDRGTGRSLGVTRNTRPAD